MLIKRVSKVAAILQVFIPHPVHSGIVESGVDIGKFYLSVRIFIKCYHKFVVDCIRLSSQMYFNLSRC